MSRGSFSDDHLSSCRDSLKLLPGVRSEEGRLFSLRVPVAGLPSAPVHTVPNTVCGTRKSWGCCGPGDGGFSLDALEEG